MTIRKILYGYQIQRGELAVVPQEAETVRRITTLYLAGGSIGGLRGRVMFRHLAGCLREQETVRESKLFPTGFALEVQGI